MRDLIVVGLGELGRLYGGAALRAGLRVTPWTREQRPEEALASLSEDTPVLLAVGEDALTLALQSLPEPRRRHSIWLQNELFPRDWAELEEPPTVLVPWLLQKRGKPLIVLHPSPVFGRHAELVLAMHRAIDIPALRIEPVCGAEALRDKYAFIVAMNALGLSSDAPLGWFLEHEQGLIESVLRESAELAGKVCEVSPAHAHVAALARTAFEALRDISPRGRTAAARIERALERATHHRLTLPTLERLYAGAKPSAT
jgi:hypothetical protein